MKLTLEINDAHQMATVLKAFAYGLEQLDEMLFEKVAVQVGVDGTGPPQYGREAAYAAAAVVDAHQAPAEPPGPTGDVCGACGHPWGQHAAVADSHGCTCVAPVGLGNALCSCDQLPPDVASSQEAHR